MLNAVAQHALASSSTLVLAAASARAAQAFHTHTCQQQQQGAAPLQRRAALQHRAAVLDIAGLGLEASPVTHPAPATMSGLPRPSSSSSSSSSADLTSEVLAFITSSGSQTQRCNIYRRSRLQI